MRSLDESQARLGCCVLYLGCDCNPTRSKGAYRALPSSQSVRNTWPIRSPLGLNPCSNTHPVVGFHGVAVGAVSGYPVRSNRKTYSEGALSLGPADTATSTTGQAMSPTTRHLPRPTPS